MTPLSVATLGLLDRGSKPALEIAVLGFLREGGTTPTPPVAGFVPAQGSQGGSSGKEYTGGRRRPGQFGSEHYEYRGPQGGPDEAAKLRKFLEQERKPRLVEDEQAARDAIELQAEIRKDRSLEARLAALEYRAQEQARLVAAVEAQRQAEIAQAALGRAAIAKFEEEVAIALLLVC